MSFMREGSLLLAATGEPITRTGADVTNKLTPTIRQRQNFALVDDKDRERLA